MLYLGENEINKIGINWPETIKVVEKTIKCLENKDFAQPLKPYLRYRDLGNRIIAMPAFVGGETNMAGIKWIASFPKNIEHAMPRAHSIVILNNSSTGEPEAIINTPLMSIIRTASVSGTVISKYLNIKARQKKSYDIGIIGWGPIGQYHYKMCKEILRGCLGKVYIYDIKQIDMNSFSNDDASRITIADSWQTVYKNADIFMTCTVSSKQYITGKPKEGGLYLNVSLRDFTVEVYEYFKNSIIVDDWDEVCREKTDIEMMHINKGLCAENVRSIIDILNDCMVKYPTEMPIMFNPMGMAVFDIATSAYYYEKAKKLDIFQALT